MLYVGLDLSRKRLDWEALLRDGEIVARGADPPDADGLRRAGANRLGTRGRAPPPGTPHLTHPAFCIEMSIAAYITNLLSSTQRPDRPQRSGQSPL